MDRVILPPVSKNPTSLRLDEDDQKALEKARKIILEKYSVVGLKLNPTNILRIALHEFVKNESPKS